MNKTKIEWADSTWNPVTGCRNGCPYCYAERIANRFGGYQLDSELDGRHSPRFDPLPGEANKDGFVALDKPLQHISGSLGVKNAPYPYGFTPTFHRYRLNEIEGKRGQTIFVCSMADLFGKWVPSRWIVDVFDACLAAPQHRYLFLTKNPERYVQLDEMALLPREENFWYGTTCTDPSSPAFYSNRHHTFVSIEPILESFADIEPPTSLSHVEWFILGAETGNRKGKVVPQREWVEPIVEFCQRNSRPVFMKDSMRAVWGDDIITQFPWEVTR